MAAFVVAFLFVELHLELDQPQILPPNAKGSAPNAHYV